MSENHRERIKTNLLSQDTEYLLDIWQNGDVDEWEKEVFEIVKEILLDRLGYVPSQSVEKQVSQILDRVEDYLENEELDKALSECEAAIQLSPNSAIAYNYLGEIYDEMEQLENAIASYQKAIQLDSEYRDAWENMLSVELELEEAFEDSIAKQHLDNALEFAYSDESEKALAECEAAKPLLPSLAIAYNYLGLILQTFDQLEPAIDSYLKAIHLNPRFNVARENLANARVRWEEEQYLTFSDLIPTVIQETVIEYDESEIHENGESIPQWLYMDKSAFLLVGWAGHRTRYGRSGYDPLERDFEFAHVLGIIIRELFDGKYRTKNPIYLFLTIFAGLMFCSPLLVLTSLNQLDLDGILITFQYVITSSSYWMTGIALLTNVILSIQPSSQNRDVA